MNTMTPGALFARLPLLVFAFYSGRLPIDSARDPKQLRLFSSLLHFQNLTSEARRARIAKERSVVRKPAIDADRRSSEEPGEER